jgi:hypothetical protein
MDRSLTKIPDVDLKIMEDMDDRTLLEFCQVSKYTRELCKNELFWKKRLIRNYGEFNKNRDRTWKQFYLKIIYYLDKYPILDNALYYISIEGIKNLDLVKFFLVRGANINRGLLGAAVGGHKNLVEFYVNNGATNIFSAYMLSDDEMAKYLLKLTAN